MDHKFSWKRFENITRVVESLGVVVIVLGPITGLVLFIVGDFILRLIGILLFFASFLIALYHISLSLMMGGLRDLMKRLDNQGQ